MRTRNLLLSVVITFLTLSSCEENMKDTSLDDFCSVKPTGWECEIIETDFNTADIPQNAETPVAIVKYYNSDREFEGIGQSTLTPSLILNFYPIEQKEEQLAFIDSQKFFSWCIPVYFGETHDYFIVTSPCFKNSGTFTEEANTSIADLYEALDKVIIKKDYN
ncbi:MAG: hypothetical protein ACK5M7_18375 [Draconibacterium sp.]